MVNNETFKQRYLGVSFFVCIFVKRIKSDYDSNRKRKIS